MSLLDDGSVEDDSSVNLVVCPNCKEEVPSTMYCLKCGYPLYNHVNGSADGAVGDIPREYIEPNNLSEVGAAKAAMASWRDSIPTIVMGDEGIKIKPGKVIIKSEGEVYSESEEGYTEVDLEVDASLDSEVDEEVSEEFPGNRRFILEDDDLEEEDQPRSPSTYPTLYPSNKPPEEEDFDVEEDLEDSLDDDDVDLEEDEEDSLDDDDVDLEEDEGDSLDDDDEDLEEDEEDSQDDDDEDLEEDDEASRYDEKLYLEEPPEVELDEEAPGKALEHDPAIIELTKNLMNSISLKLWSIKLLQDGEVDEEHFNKIFEGYQERWEQCMSRRNEMLEQARDLEALERARNKAKVELGELEIRRTIGDLNKGEYKAKAPAYRWQIEHCDEEIEKRSREIDLLMDLTQVLPSEEISKIKEEALRVSDFMDKLEASGTVSVEGLRKARESLDETLAFLDEV
jgi:hypothetical protein